MLQNDFQAYIDRYRPIMNAIHAVLGPNSEVILHNLSTPQSSVVATCGNVTNRMLGAPCTNLVIETLRKDGDNAQDILGYRTVSKDGKQMKSFTTFIREEGKIVGCLCCNIDITEHLVVEKLIHHFCQDHTIGEEKAKKEVFAQEISDVVEEIIQYELQSYGKPVAMLQRCDKLALVAALDAKGIFDVKGSPETLAQYLGVSMFTIYNYIKEVRSNNRMTEENGGNKN